MVPEYPSIASLVNRFKLRLNSGLVQNSYHAVPLFATELQELLSASVVPIAQTHQISLKPIQERSREMPFTCKLDFSGEDPLRMPTDGGL